MEEHGMVWWIKNSLRNKMTSLRHWLDLASKFSRLQSHRVSEPWRPHLATYRTGCATDHLMPDSTSLLCLLASMVMMGAHNFLADCSTLGLLKMFLLIYYALTLYKKIIARLFLRMKGINCFTDGKTMELKHYYSSQPTHVLFCREWIYWSSLELKTNYKSLWLGQRIKYI